MLRMKKKQSLPPQHTNNTKDIPFIVVVRMDITFIVLLLLVVVVCTDVTFGFHPSSISSSSVSPFHDMTLPLRQFYNNNNKQHSNNHLNYYHNRWKLYQSSSSSTNAANDSQHRIRNIFHDYHRPIVFMGCSSSSSSSSSSNSNNEIIRLASYLQEQIFIMEQPQIIILTKTNYHTILNTIQQQSYHWPDIIVLDISLFGIDNDSIDILQDIAKTLYETEQLLSIYINIDSNSLENGMKMTYEDTIFVKYTDYELCISDEGIIHTNDDSNNNDNQNNNNWEHIEWELTRILARARLLPAIPGDISRSSNTAHLLMGQHTFFLSLTFPDIRMVESYISQMCQDVDAMEYRTDLLQCRDNRFDIIYGMQLLRRYCRSHVIRNPLLSLGQILLDDVIPIVYTVRTQHQAGTYPDDDTTCISKMFTMLEWGLRAGVEILDVESNWDEQLITNLLDKAEQRYSSQILGSYHVVGKVVTIEDAVELFVQCAMDGRAHGAKVVLSIDNDDDDRMAYEAALIATEFAASSGSPVIPNISLILGDIGQFSRIINIPFTPVTHQSLPFPAAPGQLTSSEIMTTRILTKIFTPMKYAILGHNIAYSVSPQMHGAAFAATQLPHDYVRVDVATVEEFIASDLFQSDDFGGTSVTVPHKQAIIPYVDILSDAAKAIGSVNTLIAKTEFVDDDFQRIIYGDNTDWKGIYNPLNRILQGTINSKTDYALIIGAGGTARAAAYVAVQLGLQPIYYNRTPSKAQELADTFGGIVVTNLDQSTFESSSSSDPKNNHNLYNFLHENDGATIRVVISTLPAATEFTLPEWLLSMDDTKPIIFDVNYKPYSTKLLSQAENVGCTVVRGSEMLWEQGVGQFELWTGRTAPYSVMKQVVLQNCLNDINTPQQKPVSTGAFE